jgi:dihydropteroate synthase
VELLSPVRGVTNIGGRRFVWGERTYVMGVINVTPDSFSNDGVGGDVEMAVRLGVRFQEDGADIIDVGGESTRPPGIYGDSKPVSVDEELGRVVPMIEAIKRETDLPVSIDTYKAAVAQAAIEAGASIINDIWAFQRDPEMRKVAADAVMPVVLMHNQVGTEYDDPVPDIVESLRQRVDAAVHGGVRQENIIVDPGMGFGKTAEQNLEILRRLGEFDTLGLPLLVGMSRKSTIGYVLGLPVEDRVEGTAATVALSIAGGADIVRVHDVKEMSRVARMTDAVIRGWSQADAG